MASETVLPYPDRAEAGRRLARRLGEYAGREDVIVLGLPRGGVPVAFEVAAALRAPLDLMVVRKLGTPGQEELAMGAIGSGGARVLNEEIVAQLGLSDAAIERVEARERRELARREEAYRGERPPPELAGRCVILVDDGLATGATMRAAIAALRPLHPARIVVAVPVAPPDVVARLRREADEVVCPETPEPYVAVGRWYVEFSQTGDDEVRELLRRNWESG
jgi:putative phosphoribosyl transferase